MTKGHFPTSLNHLLLHNSGAAGVNGRVPCDTQRNHTPPPSPQSKLKEYLATLTSHFLVTDSKVIVSFLKETDTEMTSDLKAADSNVMLTFSATLVC